MSFIDNLYIGAATRLTKFKEKTAAFFANDDGVSNIVATIILVLIVVLLLGLLWGFLQGWLGDLIGKIKNGGNEVETTAGWN